MHRGFALQCFSLKCCCLFSDFSSLTSRYLYCVWDHWYRNWTPVVWRKSLQGVQGLSFFSPVRSWTWPVLPLWYTIHTWLCVHSHVTQVFTCNIVILTLGAHAQQGLQYFVCLSVGQCVCQCLFWHRVCTLELFIFFAGFILGVHIPVWRGWNSGERFDSFPYFNIGAEIHE